jgi:hypothetical protein
MEESGYQFEPHYGSSNKMTWAVFTEIGSDFHTLTLLRNVAETEGQDGLKTQIQTWVDRWFTYKKVPEGMSIFMPSMLNCAIDYTWWWEIVDALQEERAPIIDNPFTQILYDAIKTMDWRAVTADPPEPEASASTEEQIALILSTPDERLKEHFRVLLLTWAETRARRMKTPAHFLARKIVQTYLDQADWERVYEKYMNS